METKEFHNMLIEQSKTMLVGGVTRYQHVERMGSTEVEGLLDSHPIIIQEKIDGANLTVANVDSNIVVCSRRKHIATLFANGDEQINGAFNGAVEYVKGHKGIRALLLEDHPEWILRGEWLIKHTINYAPGAWRKFYVFDVQLLDGTYIPVTEYCDVLTWFGIEMVPLIGVYDKQMDIGDLIKIADRPSMLGSVKAEGIVVKRYDFVNHYGRTVWGKTVNADFQNAAKVEGGAGKRDPIEVRFISSCVSEAMIDKVIANIENDVGRKLEPRDIKRVIDTVWHDVVTEETWNFIKRAKWPTIDFRVAVGICADKVRNRVLAYLGGGLREE